MKLLLAIALPAVLCAQIPVTGNFANPDGTALTGSLRIQLAQPTVTYNCATPVQALTFSQVSVPITNGVLGSLNLYATPCLTQGTTNTASMIMTNSAGQLSSYILTGTNISITGGNGSLAGVMARFTPGLAGTLNQCMFTPVSTNTQNNTQFTFPFNGKTVAITSKVPLITGVQYTWSYACGQPYSIRVMNTRNQLLYTAKWILPLLNGLGGAQKRFKLPNGLMLYGLTGTSANVNSIDTALQGGGIGSADMTVTSSHAGNFTLSQTGAVYTLTAANSGSAVSSGTVTVVDTLPSGLTATALSGTGWSCTLGTKTCTRSDALAATTSYPPITLTVNVSGSAAPSITNTVTISGGGETFTANDTWNDVTVVNSGPIPDLTLTKTHTGSSFTPGQTGVVFTLTPNNIGLGASTGTITVVDTLPAGLTATAMTGMGWTCNVGTLTCTSTGVIASMTSTSNPITLTVTIGSTTTGTLTNTATVSGGGETDVANDGASNAITVGGAPDLTITSSHSGSFTQWQNGATYTLTATNSGNLPTSGTVTVVDTLPPSIAATAMNGAGWSCNAGTLTCTRTDALASSASYPAITLTVNVSGTAPSSANNVATVSGGGEVNTSNDTSTDGTTITQEPDLTTTKTHTGNFSQSQTGATFTITVSNAGSASTSGTVTLVDTLPTGLTATALTGTGWTCTLGTLTCTRSSVLAATASYPAITLTVNVSATAANSLSNIATVSGGGELNTSNDAATDVVTVGNAPDLTISQMPTGTFTQGQTGAAYAISVTNSGTIATTGTVTVVDTLPTGLTATAIAGTGWTCTLGSLTCTRTDSILAGAGYPAITLTVNVASNAMAMVTNTAVCSGGGEVVTSNDTSAYVTTVLTPTAPDLTITKTHTGNFTQGQTGALYSITVTNSGNAVTAGTVTVVDTLPSAMTATALSGTGWTCTLSTKTCTRMDTLAAGSSYPLIALTVTATSAGTVSNIATVSGGGETNTSNDTATNVTIITGNSDLTITKTHTGNFNAGQTGATFTITATNSGTGATVGTVTVVDTLPTGLTATAMAGTGWACTLGTLTCTRSDALAASMSYPAITLTVNVATTFGSRFGPGRFGASVINVSAPTGTASTDIASINNAIGSSSPGDTINFAAGTYNTAGTTIQLNSDNRTYTCATAGTCIISNPNNMNFTVSATRNTMTVTKLAMIGCGIELSGSSTLFVNPTITYNSFSTCNANFGTFLNENYGVSGGNFSHNTFTDGGSCYLNDGTCDGNFSAIHMYLMPNTVIDSNTFTHVERGIGQYYQSTDTLPQPGIRITNNTFTRLHARSIEVQGLNKTGQVISGNYAHKWQNAYYGSWGLSMADGFGSGSLIAQNTLIQNNVFDARDSVANDLVSPMTDATLCMEVSGQNTTVDHNECLSLTNAAPGTALYVTGFDQGILSGMYNGTISNQCFGGTFISSGAPGQAPQGTVQYFTYGDGGTSTTTNLPAVTGTLEYTDANSCPNVLGNTPPVITSTSFPAGTQGSAYSQTATVSGGAAPFTWTISTGSLPTGLTLAGATGIISGTPTTAGSSTFTLKVTDSNAATNSVSITLVINAPVSSGLTNTTMISGGGETNTSNDTATDTVQINLGPISDNFNGGTLSSFWTFVHPSGGTQSMTGTQAQINVPSGAVYNMNNVPDSAPRITQPTGNVDMTMTVKFDTIPTVADQYEGLVADQDSMNWLTFHYASDGTNTYVSADKIVAGSETNLLSTMVSIGGATSLWLRVVRAGNVWTESWSTDGATYTTEGSFTQAFTIADVGIFGGNYNAVPASAPAFTVKADSFITPSAAAPDMTITKSHTGNFTLGETGAVYTITATNAGGATTSGTVTVTDTVPSGETATALSGTGWTCTVGTGVCTRSDALAAGASYPAITLTVTVSNTAASMVTNSVTVGGGGETDTSNDTATDPTAITAAAPISDNFNAGSLNTALWTFVNPGGGTESMTGTQLQLNVPGAADHDPNFTGADETVRVVQASGNVDFNVTVKFDSIPSMQYQFQGIKAEQDADANFTNFQIASDGSILVCGANVVVSGSETQPFTQATITGSPTSVWLRVVRAGNVWTESYSVNGTSYTTCGTFTQAYTINNVDIWGGNFNNTTASSPAFTVLADSFTSM